MQRFPIKRVLRSLVRALLKSILILLATTFAVFVLIKLAPGDPYIGWSDALKSSFGVNDPLIVQYLSWLGGIVVLDWGHSIQAQGKAVLSLSVYAYFNTLFIVLGALVVALLIAIPLGLYSAANPHSRLTRHLTRLLEIVSSTPVFISGYFVFFFFISTLNINFVLRNEFSYPALVLFYLSIFAVLGIGNGSVIELIKHVRREATRAMKSVHMIAVRARGANYRTHLARTISVPILSVISERIIFLLSGAVVVEYLFSISGAGLVGVVAAQHRDYPVLLAITVLTILLVTVIRGCVRLMVKQIDPRV